MNGKTVGPRRPRPKFRSKRRVLGSFVAVLALIAASCGTSDTSATGGSSEQQSSSGSAASGNVSSAAVTPTGAFPDTKVVNLADGSEVKFNETLAGGTTPILMWFYFPH